MTSNAHPAGVVIFWDEYLCRLPTCCGRSSTPERSPGAVPRPGTGFMRDPVCGLPRITLPRTRVNRGRKKGRAGVHGREQRGPRDRIGSPLGPRPRRPARGLPSPR
jgi:hypothetical protein